MKYHEFLAVARDRGKYGDQAEVEQAARTVLGALGARLTRDEAEDLASQLPEPLPEAVLAESAPGGTRWSLEEFLDHIGSRLRPGDIEATRRAATVVLTTVADSVDSGQLNHLLTQLPSSYASLFGWPQMA